MIDIYLPTARLELKNNKIYDYLEDMGMEYEFLPYSDFDFILKKKQISELIDYRHRQSVPPCGAFPMLP